MAEKTPHREARSKRLLMRPLRMEDAEGVFIMRSDPAVMKFTPTLPETDLNQSKEWINMCLNRENCYNFSVELLNNADGVSTKIEGTRSPKVIGVIGAIRTPEVGYMINPQYGGKGIATEALQAFMDQLFWDHIAGKIDPPFAKADVDPEHTPSRRVLEKCGFTVYQIREKDFDSPTLGLRDSVEYRCSKPAAQAS